MPAFPVHLRWLGVASIELRVQVFYGRPDLKGGWEGALRIEEAANLAKYVESGLAQVLLLVGLAENEAEAREIASEAVVEDPNMRQERPLGILFEVAEGAEPGRYRARAFAIDDSGGSQQEYAGEATYEKGQDQFSFRAPDGSAFHFSGTLTGSDRLSGTFTIGAWGIAQNAGSGVWKLSRTEP
jgi:mono/diheme cytochrome c family protein